MLVSLTVLVVCFCLCSSVNSSLDYLKKSEISGNHMQPKIINSYDNFFKQSRYSKFDRVLTRLEKMNSESSEVDTKILYKLRHKGWNIANKASYTSPTTATTTTTTETNLFENYGDLDSDEDYIEDYEDHLMEDESYYVDKESETEDPFFEDVMEEKELQAEEPTETPTTTLKPSALRSVSGLTDYKWNHFGTRAKVEESRRQQLNLKPPKEQSKVNAVLEHYLRVNQQSKCLTPLPRVIPVQREHPDPSKIFTPQCTILYRCAEDSGCCGRDSKCQHKRRVLVPLYFYAKSVGSSQNKIVKLELYNHTECECKEISSPNNALENVGITLKSAETHNSHNHIPSVLNEKRCNCPKPFRMPRFGHKCTCDCERDDEDCNHLKKGREHLSMNTRICIQEDKCGLPACEYGTYMMKEGKCPTKMEKLEEYRKLNI